MDEYIGMTVLVTLQNPPHAEIRGTVTNIVAQQLYLSQVTWISSNTGVESFVVDGGNILDLVIEAENRPSIPLEVEDKSVINVDPAILSYNRPPRKDESSSRSLPLGDRLDGPQSVPQPIAPDALAQSPSPSPAIIPLIPIIPITIKPKGDVLISSVASENVTSATLTGPFTELSLDGGHQNHIMQENTAKEIAIHQKDVSPAPEQPVLVQAPAKNAGKRPRRGAAKGRTAEDGGSAPGRARFSQQETLASAVSKSPNTPRRPRGTREISLTEDPSQSNRPPIAPSDGSFSRLEVAQPKKKARRHRPKISEDQNGWATEEVTDIQDMGDFDFEANLSKFDKHGVFNKIREADATAEADRLVSFNRIPGKIGTTVRNLHHTENVLSPNAIGHLAWNSGDSEKDVNETRVSSIRSLSRASLRKAPSRKGSSLYGTENLTSSGVLPDLKTRNLHLSHDQAGSTKTHNPSSPFYSRANSRSRAALRITPSNHICPCLNPLQMVELEQLSISELGLTEDIITENASRGIAETARRVVITEREKSILALPGGSPLVVILVGNTKSGSRAVAAGRQLRNHGYRVVVCVLGLEREDDLLESVRRQLSIYRKCGGHVTKADGLEKSLQQMQAPIELIVDALLGMHLLFDDLRTDDQTSYFQLATWANASEVGVLAVDIPSGLDASSGLPTIIEDGTDLVIHAEYVVSLGAPKAGLLAALIRSTAYERWTIFVADIGISNIAWRKFGTRHSRSGVEFGNEWVATLRYQAGVEYGRRGSIDLGWENCQADCSGAGIHWKLWAEACRERGEK